MASRGIKGEGFARGQEFRAKGPQPLPPRLPPARVESPERQSLFGNYG